MSSATVYVPLERSQFFEDHDGAIATTKYEDEIVQLVIDWSDALASGETISSAAYVDSGVTRSSTSATTTTTTTSVGGTGETEITATLSTGRKLIKVARFYPHDAAPTSDYR